MTEKKKCSETTECKNGHHTFIATSWLIHGGKQKAIFMRCQHCLLPMDLTDLESKEWRTQEGI